MAATAFLNPGALAPNKTRWTWSMEHELGHPHWPCFAAPSPSLGLLSSSAHLSIQPRDQAVVRPSFIERDPIAIHSLPNIVCLTCLSPTYLLAVPTFTACIPQPRRHQSITFLTIRHLPWAVLVNTRASRVVPCASIHSRHGNLDCVPWLTTTTTSTPSNRSILCVGSAFARTTPAMSQPQSSKCRPR